MQDSGSSIQSRCPGTVSRRDVLKYAASAPVLLSLPTMPLVGPPRAGATSALAGRMVFLDPGHNGANDASISYQVTNGRGRTKECQTTGTSTDAGYPEHSFNWDVVLRIRAALTALGVRTAMSRGNDNALGPCVDQRAAMANALQPDAIVSIHADGAPSSGHGFHVNECSRRPEGATAATVAKSEALGRAEHDALAHGSGLVPSTYIGTDGYVHRSDFAGLNLSTAPTTFLEVGNMRNGGDAALQSSRSGRQRIAEAIAAGILAFLA